MLRSPKLQYLQYVCVHIDYKLCMQYNSTSPDTDYPDRLGPSGKFVDNTKKKLSCLAITGYQIKYSTVLWLLDLQIRRGRKV